MTEDPLADIFARLQRSPFRARFALKGKDRVYLASKGLDVVLGHGREFISKKLAPAHPANDGKQTPMRGHPVFVAQHATATCCRGCLEKWHGIARGHALTQDEREYVVRVIACWLKAQGITDDPPQSRLL